jgi:hypothetical protein
MIMEFQGIKKRIKCFWDVVGTIDGLVHPSFDSGAKKNFFEKLKEMEEAYEAIADITLVTGYDNDFGVEAFDKIKYAFERSGMEGRVRGCQTDEAYIDEDGRVQANERVYGDVKFNMVGDYYKNREEDEKNVVMCVYAGDSLADAKMAQRHEGAGMFEKLPKIYEGRPCFYVNANDSNASFHYVEGEERPISIQNGRVKNFEALTKGFGWLTNNKELMMSKGSVEKQQS